MMRVVFGKFKSAAVEALKDGSDLNWLAGSEDCMEEASHQVALKGEVRS